MGRVWRTFKYMISFCVGLVTFSFVFIVAIMILDLGTLPLFRIMHSTIKPIFAIGCFTLALWLSLAVGVLAGGMTKEQFE